MRMMMRRTIGLSLALLVVSAAAIAKETSSAHQPTTPQTKHPAAKTHAAAAAQDYRKRHHEHAKAAKHAAGKPARRLPPPDEYIGPVQVVGKREIGGAAWYGGRHIGRRTASGDRLDAIHATAAHRSLPLRSLVRVTNLSNGRSVIARITDRGPVSHSLVIDVSPRVATELDMKRAGIITVAIDPVAPTTSH